MTFEELDNELPNGFHDAQLHSVRIDYVRGTMTLHMSFWVGDLNGPNKENTGLESYR